MSEDSKVENTRPPTSPLVAGSTSHGTYITLHLDSESGIGISTVQDLILKELLKLHKLLRIRIWESFIDNKQVDLHVGSEPPCGSQDALQVHM